MKKYLSFFSFASIFIIAFSAQAQNTVLKANSNFDKKLLKAEIHNYSLLLEKGQYAECIVMQKGVDLGVDLISPSGKKLKTFDSPNGENGPEPVSIIADESGNYLLHICAVNLVSRRIGILLSKTVELIKQCALVS